MKQIIGSRMAAKLARTQFGERAYVARVGKKFEIGTFSRGLCFFYGTRLVQGSGKSWEAALRDAGVEIPVGASNTDTMPEDTDAKEPDLKGM